MDPLYNKTSFGAQYRLSHLRKTGGHLPYDLVRNLGEADKDDLLHGDGITVWEQGSLIEVPDLASQTGAQVKAKHLWTVVRVLSHTTPVKETEKDGDQLDLSSEDSLSAGSLEGDASDGMSEQETRLTFELQELKTMERDPVPDGFLRKLESHALTNPRLTLVFLAYERPVGDVTK